MIAKTLIELLDVFLDHLQARRFSRHTIRQARYGNLAFLRWLRDAQEVQAAGELRLAHLEAWQRHLAGQTAKGRPLKPRTVNKKIELARNLLRHLAGCGHVGRHLTDALQYVKEPKVLPGSVLNHAQARRMLDGLATDTPVGYRNRAMLELLYTSGIRAGELVGLDVGHVDFPNGTALVTGKGEKQRAVPIGRTALRLLENYVKGARPFLVAAPSERALFLDGRGRRLPYHTLLRLVHACAARVGARPAESWSRMRG